MLKKKVCLIGSFAVGKTSLVSRFVEGIFSDKYLTTLGVKIDRKVVTTRAGEMSLMLWDMAGEDKFEHLQTSYIRGASGVLFVADGTRAETLEKVVEYIGRVREMEPNAAGVVLVNKCDLASEWEVGDTAEVSAAAHGLPSFATSAKTGVNVESAFEALCEQMVSSHG